MAVGVVVAVVVVGRVVVVVVVVVVVAAAAGVVVWLLLLGLFVVVVGCGGWCRCCWCRSTRDRERSAWHVLKLEQLESCRSDQRRATVKPACFGRAGLEK